MPESNGGGATRNGEPLYDIAAKRIIHHLVTETPVRTSSLRGLGAMPNVFALECCIDELAERAGQDPVAYRLSITADKRARAVIEKAAAMARWNAKEPGGTGHGRGIAFARYKNRAAYAAVVVELDVAEEIRLAHVWCATDAGLVINPDGVDQPARRRHHPVGELGAQGAGALRQRESASARSTGRPIRC